jgi:hypothetical protein
METKICTKCAIEKPIDLFTKDNKIKSGYTSRCKECTADYKREHRKLNADIIAIKRRVYYQNNKKIINDKYKVYREKNKTRIRERENRYVQKNKEKITIYQKEYKQKNRDKRAKYEKEKQLSDPLYALSNNIRKNISKIFRQRGFKKVRKSEDILGCTFEEFKNYIENLFEPWMSWENRGLYNGELNYGWDIDHIIPIVEAKTEEDIIRLNHYTNLQPLCSRVNRNIKRNRYES